MSLKFILRDPLLSVSWTRWVRLWKPLLLWTLLCWLLIAAFLTPLTSYILGMQLLRGGKLLVGNEALLDWIRSPYGLLYIWLFGSLTLLGFMLQFGGMFYIFKEDERHRSFSLRQTLSYLVIHLPRMLKISLAIILSMMIWVLPLIMGLSLIYYIFLGSFDINYYLAVQPREWYYAIVAGGIWTLLWVGATLWALLRCLPMLPLYLDRNKSLYASFRLALKQSGGHQFWRISKLLGTTIILWMLSHLLADLILYMAGYFSLQWITKTFISLYPFMMTTGLFLGLTLIVEVLLNFIGLCYISSLLTLYYDEQMGRTSSNAVETQMTKKHRLLSYLRPRYLLLGAAGLLGISAVGTSWTLNQLPAIKQVSISAHRAGPPPAPENTLAAMEGAIKAGADFAEIDVRLTRDSIPVVIHDTDLMRVAGKPEHVSDITFDTLKNIRLKASDENPAEARSISRLEAFLTRAKNRIKLLIELKYRSFDPLLAQIVTRKIQRHQMINQVRLMSFSQQAVRQLHQMDSRLSIGFLSAATIGNPLTLPVDFLAISQRSVTPALLDKAFSHQTEIHIWTVNQPQKMADFIEMGVDGIITDYPRRAVKVLEEMQTMNEAERLLLQMRKIYSGRLLNLYTSSANPGSDGVTDF